MPLEATKEGALVAGTGHSGFPNQINNVRAFPCILVVPLTFMGEQSMRI